MTRKTKTNSSLLDEVLANRAKQGSSIKLSPKQNKLQQLNGDIAVYDSTVAAIERVFALNPHLHRRFSGVPVTTYTLYNGHTPIDLNNKRTFLSIIKADWVPTSPYQLTFLIDCVTDSAPTLSYDAFYISEGLIWDRNTSTLRRLNGKKPFYTVS